MLGVFSLSEPYLVNALRYCLLDWDPPGDNVVVPSTGFNHDA